MRLSIIIRLSVITLLLSILIVQKLQTDTFVENNDKSPAVTSTRSTISRNNNFNSAISGSPSPSPSSLATAMSLFANTTNVASAAALFPKTVSDMQTLVAEAKARTIASLAAIYDVSTTSVGRTFKNTARATDFAESELDTAASIISVVKSTSPSKELRDEARKHLVDLEAFSIDSFSNNKKLYKCLRDYLDTEEYKTIPATEDGANPLSGERKYWIDEEVSEMKRSGLELEGEAFENVVALQKKIADLSTTFETNVAEDKTELYIAEADLAGTPAPIVKALAKKENDPEGRLVVKLDYPTYFGIMKNCVVAKTRKLVAEAFENRAYPANLGVLQDVIKARHQLAKQLGYTSFAAYNLENKMIKSPANAAKFIDDLVPGLQKKWELEKKLLIENLHPSVELTPEGDLYGYDIAFSINHIKQSKLNVDETEIQKYFPMDSTVKALFDIYQSFFDITFVQHNNGKDALWHEEVSTLEVIDNATKAVLGYVVLDLFPREGKFTHACCHSVVPPCEKEDGTFSPALTVVIANFPKATADAPALFLHDDVETFFHEFGHAIHGLMGRSKMCTFAGTRVKRDFVELPSQMLEEWLWDRAILQKVSNHYVENKPLPDALIDAKIASQNAFSGRDSLRQLQFARYSLEIFDEAFNAEGSDLDTTKLYRAIQDKTIKGIKSSDAGHFQCAFGHLMGYGAGYYGYMWSEVLAQDVFNYIKARDGLLSPELGRRYVKHIIGPGGSKDPNVLVKGFLEREPNNAAFLGKLGIKL